MTKEIKPCAECGTTKKGEKSYRCKACNEKIELIRKENKSYYKDNLERLSLSHRSARGTNFYD